MALPVDDARHGTVTGYVNHFCRCQPCRTAGSLYWRSYRAARRAARRAEGAPLRYDHVRALLLANTKPRCVP